VQAETRLKVRPPSSYFQDDTVPSPLKRVEDTNLALLMSSSFFSVSWMQRR